MKRLKRIVDTGFWSDEKVLEEFTPEDKYFMLFLLTNEYTTQLGVYYLPIKKASFDLGYAEDATRLLIERFESKYDIIMYSTTTGEIAIKNYLLYSIVSGGKPVFDLLVKEATAVRDKELLKCIYNHLSIKDIQNNTVKTFIEYLNNYLNNTNTINDNDNEESYPESSTNRTTNRGTNRTTNRGTNRTPNRTPKNPKHKYGEYQNVLLTDEEYQKLTEEYGEAKRDKCIEKLSGYLASKGDKYKSHYATIRNWVKDAVNETKTTNKVADQLEESYRMMAEWGKKHED